MLVVDCRQNMEMFAQHRNGCMWRSFVAHLSFFQLTEKELKKQETERSGSAGDPRVRAADSVDLLYWKDSRNGPKR